MPQAPRSSSTSLVIADDAADMRWLVRSAIGDEFAEVVEVADGRELFWHLLREDFASRPAQLVVTDLSMPAYDGLDVLAAWRELQPSAPAILITAYPSENARRRAEAAGAVLLAKPFSTAALRAAIREALATTGRGTPG